MKLYTGCIMIDGVYKIRVIIKQTTMTTIPKLNYANLRGKSKSKDSEYSERKLQNASSDLFSHMNQDNLKYIQSQIKQKSRKSNNSAMLSNREQGERVQGKFGVPQKIEEKDSKYEETERQATSPLIQNKIKILKTEGESVKEQVNIQLLPPSKASQEAETHKQSYYDLISQAKSHRLASIQGYCEDQNAGYTSKSKDNPTFLGFLNGYIEEMITQSKVKGKRKITKVKNKQTEQVSSISVSSASERDILKSGLAQQKARNMQLAKQIEHHRIQQQNHQIRIQKLENVVQKLVQELSLLRDQFTKRPLLQKAQNNFHNISSTMPMYQYAPQPSNKHSHRKNNTSFSLISNEYRHQGHSNSQHQHQHQDYAQHQNNNNGYSHHSSHSRKTQKVYNQKIQEIDILRKQYAYFMETGQCRLKQ